VAAAVTHSIFGLFHSHWCLLNGHLGVHRGVVLHLVIDEIIVEDIGAAPGSVIAENTFDILAVATAIRLGGSANCSDFLVLLVNCRSHHLSIAICYICDGWVIHLRLASD